MLMKLSDYVMDFVAQQGVQHVFTLPGGGCMHLTDSLGRNPSLSYVCMLHEQAVSIAADAYAQYTGGLGACLVTTGPGGTNAITGVCASWIDSTPVLILSGQVKRADRMIGRGVRQMGNQEVDIISIVKPVTKYAVTVTDPEMIRYHLEKAVQIAMQGRRGPVWIDIPLDVQAAQVEAEKLKGFDAKTETNFDKVDLSSVARDIVQMLEQSEKPVLLAGCGLRLAGCRHELAELVELLRIPVLTTWRGADLLAEDSPYFAGRPGSIAQRGANYTQQRADFLLIVGARLDLPQTAYNHRQFASQAKKVIVDIDSAEIDKLDMQFALKIQADAKAFVRALIRELKAASWTAGQSGVDSRAWLKQTMEWKKQYPVVLPAYWTEDQSGVNTYCLMDALSEHMGASDILVPGSSGACAEISMQAFKFKAGQRAINCPGLGAMGFDLPMALGAGVAGEGRMVVCIAGDGGVQMNIQELATLKRLGLNLKMFVLNNQGYGSIRGTQRNYFDSRYYCSNEASGLHLADILRVAEAYDLPVRKLCNHADLKHQLPIILQEPGPCVIEVMTPEDLPAAPRVMSRQKTGGGMETSGMEDLWPESESPEK